MGIEIERKFLVKGRDWKQGQQGTLYRQGYLLSDPSRTVRVRIAGSKGFLTIKGPAEGYSRMEFEYEIPSEDASQLMELLCPKPLIEKLRFRISHSGMIWDVDDFLGANEGLVLAEIELESVGQAFDRPLWIGKEVTGDPRYYNAYLAEHPYATWTK